MPTEIFTSRRARTMVLLAGTGVLIAALSVLEQVSIVFMDHWIPLTSMEQAEWLTVAISTLAEVIKVAILGGSICLIMRPTVGKHVRWGRFLGLWGGVAVLLGALLLGFDSAGYFLQFGGMPMGGESFRAAFLLLIYAKTAVYFVVLRGLFGAGHYATGQATGLFSAWRSTPLGTSLALTAIYIALWLSIEGVIIPMLSYLPAIAPFWFIPGEAASHRFLVGQGTRLLGEAIGAALYVLVWIWALGHALLPKASETSGS
ncbi:hypothetical protein [Devosia marina]|uniref:Uncharacterized protein n=1 Tax=Devosia marina TaxID=2683198 RepID=A0A7X3K2A9_9HYPH|nr:hypothetical protein [Devosia marina]MVS97429.1 hypothetical protein [Devosia marina]